MQINRQIIIFGKEMGKHFSANLATAKVENPKSANFGVIGDVELQIKESNWITDLSAVLSLVKVNKQFNLYSKQILVKPKFILVNQTASTLIFANDVAES